MTRKEHHVLKSEDMIPCFGTWDIWAFKSENQKSLSRNGRVIGLPPINAMGTESLWFVKVVFMEKKNAQNIAFSEALITVGLIRSDLELIHADICEPTKTPSLTTEDPFFSSLMIIHRWCGFMAHIWRKRKWAGHKRLENRSWRRIYFQVFLEGTTTKEAYWKLKACQKHGFKWKPRIDHILRSLVVLYSISFCLKTEKILKKAREKCIFIGYSDHSKRLQETWFLMKKKARECL